MKHINWILIAKESVNFLNKGIDFTISNLENGTKTFNGRSLHYYDDEIKNPYQKVNNLSDAFFLFWQIWLIFQLIR